MVVGLVALLAPGLWHRLDVKNSSRRQRAYASFAAEFLDSIQGLATLKAFGQGKSRADRLEIEAHDVFEKTMWVLATNALARGITDCSIAIGAAGALIYGAVRVESGAMALTSLLIILMLGVEIFRPMRELRNVLHQGMVGLSAAQGIYRILDDKPAVLDAAAKASPPAIEPTISFEDVRFTYPGTRRRVHDGLSFTARAGERLGIVGESGSGKSATGRAIGGFPIDFTSASRTDTDPGTAESGQRQRRCVRHQHTGRTAGNADKPSLGLMPTPKKNARNSCGRGGGGMPAVSASLTRRQRGHGLWVSTKSSNRISSDSGFPTDAKISVSRR